MEYRFKELKQRLDKTNKQIAEDLKVSPYTVDSWTSGHRSPHPSNIQLIENLYGLNPGWLSGDTDEMYPSAEQNHRRKQVKEIMTCQTDFAIDTVCKLAEASESDWKTLEKILK